MPTQQQYVAVWASGASVQWRGLTMKEYRQLSNKLKYEPEMLVYCDLYRLVTNSEESLPLTHIPAGVVDFLGRRLLKESAFGGDINKMKAALIEKRNNLDNNYYEQGKAVIAGVFRYTFEEIESWDEDTFFECLAKAELISGENLEPRIVGEDSNLEQVPVQDKPRKAPKRPLTAAQQLVFERKAAMRQG